MQGGTPAVIFMLSEQRGPAHSFEQPAPLTSAVGSLGASGSGSGARLWRQQRLLVFVFLLVQREPLAHIAVTRTGGFHMEAGAGAGVPLLLQVPSHGTAPRTGGAPGQNMQCSRYQKYSETMQSGAPENCKSLVVALERGLYGAVISPRPYSLAQGT